MKNERTTCISVVKSHCWLKSKVVYDTIHTVHTEQYHVFLLKYKYKNGTINTKFKIMTTSGREKGMQSSRKKQAFGYIWNALFLKKKTPVAGMAVYDW